MTTKQLSFATQTLLEAAIKHGLATEEVLHAMAKTVYRAAKATASHDNYYIVDFGEPSFLDYGTAMQMIEAGGATAMATQLELEWVAKGFPQEVYNVPLWQMMKHIEAEQKGGENV